MTSKFSLKTCILLNVISLPLTINSATAQATFDMSDNTQIIRKFIQSWSSLDAEELADYFTEDGIYYNIPSSPVSGRDNVARFIAGFIRNWESTEWEIINLFANGDLVVAERVDHTVVNGSPVDLPAMGIFEMEDGKIKLWRDYFNLPTYTEALAAALQQ